MGYELFKVSRVYTFNFLQASAQIAVQLSAICSFKRRVSHFALFWLWLEYREAQARGRRMSFYYCPETNELTLWARNLRSTFQAEQIKTGKTVQMFYVGEL